MEHDYVHVLTKREVSHLNSDQKLLGFGGKFVELY
jgi:hypothetical protein